MHKIEIRMLNVYVRTTRFANDCRISSQILSFSWLFGRLGHHCETNSTFHCQIESAWNYPSDHDLKD